MNSTVRDKNYVKVFILYLLWNIDSPLDFGTINDIAIQDGYVGYFDFAQCFAELIDDGHVIETHGENGERLYSITEKGINVAENLSEDIFSEIRDKSLRSAMKLISFRKRRAELRYDCADVPDSEGGGYCVTCGIIEHGRPTCSITIKVDTKARADAIKRNFYENPETVFRGTLALLLGDVNYIF